MPVDASQTFVTVEPLPRLVCAVATICRKHGYMLSSLCLQKQSTLQLLIWGVRNFQKYVTVYLRVT